MVCLSLSSLTHRAALAALSAALLVVVSTLSAFAEELILDNTSQGVQVKGNWSATSTTPGFYGSNYLFRTAGDGSSTVTWPFPGNALGGKYEVFVLWSGGPNRASNAAYQINFDGGSNTASVNQKNAGVGWKSLGVFSFQPNKGQGVTLSDKADGVVAADAVRWVGPQPAQQAAGQAAPAQQQLPVAQPAPSPAPSAPVAQDERFFAQTRYRIGEDAFWDYFNKRGGVGTFGYPVSNTFSLLGMKVQVFQRQVLQLRPDGGVQTMNILDEGLMPYTKINGSNFPAPDPNVIKGSPTPDDPDYLEKAMKFVKDTAPDQFDGEQVNFAGTFFSSVKPEDAFPNGVPEGLEGLLPAFNIEIWGLPTSRPTYDPTNRNFIYQRFQRGIMHYDKGCGCTQGLLLADYFKAILTGRNVPGDLAAQARGSRFFGQWAPGKPGWLARPNDLPASSLDNAFRRDPMVTLDPGHGGAEIGTSHKYPDGVLLQEKELNLRVALKVRDLLQQAGYDVTMTRTTDSQVNTDKKDLNGDGKVSLSDDLQARVDVANNARSDLLVSIHFNGMADPAYKGTFVFYDPDRPHSDRNKALAEIVDAAIVKAMKDAGYTPVDRGARLDTSVLGGEHYFLLSPKSDWVARPSEMPAVIGEALFLTNDDDANALRNDKVVDAIARGYAEGIKAYFAKYPPS